MSLKLWITRIPLPHPSRANPGRKPGVRRRWHYARDEDEKRRPTKEPPLCQPELGRTRRMHDGGRIHRRACDRTGGTALPVQGHHHLVSTLPAVTGYCATKFAAAAVRIARHHADRRAGELEHVLAFVMADPLHGEFVAVSVKPPTKSI